MKYGLYRRLDDGRLEYFHICQPEIREFKAVWGPHLKDMLDKYLPEEPDPVNYSGG